MFVFLPIALIATLLTALSVMLGCAIGNRHFWSCTPPKYWSKIICRLSLCRVKINKIGDLDVNTSYVFVANHQGAFDIFLMYGYLGHDIKWVQKQSLRNIPFVGAASEAAGHVFVNQSNIKSIKESVQKIRQQLSDENASIAIFPEGSRTVDGRLGRFKRGAFIIAKEMKLAIVPITVNGPYDVLKSGCYLIKPGLLEMTIHAPISIENMVDEDIPHIMEECRETIYSGLWDKYK